MGVDAMMFFKTKQKLSKLDVRKLAVRLAEGLGPDMFSIWNEPDSSWSHHALEIADEDEGSSISKTPDELLIQVHLAGRYYGEGYERGSLADYIAVANWIEFHIPDAKIFYGGDSSDIYEPFNNAARNELWAYFCQNGHSPYTNGFGLFSAPKEVVCCSFCAERPMTNCGGGGGDTFLYCAGCGKKAIQWADGSVKVMKRNEDFFKAHKER